MEYRKNYFDSGAKFHSQKGILYKIRDFLLPAEKIRYFSDKHYFFLLKDKWDVIRNSKKVLDVGCGKGQFMKAAPKNVEAHGIDISEEVSELKRKGFNVKKADVTKKFPYKNSEFDAVVSFHVLEHLENPINFVSECKRVLKKDGTIMIAVPNFSFKGFYADYTHQRPYPREALFRLLNDYGFYNIKIKNGVGFNKLISALLFFFPKSRYKVEKFKGFFRPWEIVAIARKGQ